MGFLENFGFVALIYVITRLGLFIYRLLYPTRIDITKLGRWALITGSTDGIGKAYALELAKRGFNVILISRTKEKLDQVEKEIRGLYANVDVRTIQFDFTKSSSTYSTIRDGIRNLDIGVLINNVGMSYTYPETFDKVDDGETFLNNMIRCNVDSVANLTHMILPGMIKNQRGLIVNVSSISGRQPTPLLSLYSGTKGFIDLFSRSLHAECISRGVYVQSLCPGYVVSKLSGIRKASLTAPTPEKFVKSSLDRVTLPFTTGYWTHEIQDFIQSMLPEYVFNALTMRVLGGIRAKALKKLNKER